MKRALYLALFLAITAGLAGGMLSFVNNITEEKIASATLAKEKDNLEKIFPGATFVQKTSEVKDAESDGILDLFVAEGKGKVYKVKSKGYGGDVVFLVGFDTQDTIAGIAIISHGETKGIGDVITSDAYQSKLVGKKAGDSIDVSAGATYSSTAINNGVRAAFKHLTGSDVSPTTTPQTSLNLGSKVSLNDEKLKSYKNEITNQEEVDGNTVYTVTSEGYGKRDPEYPSSEYKANEFKITINNSNNEIVKVEVVVFGDTKGIGEKIVDEEYLKTFVGVSSLDAQVDTVSGATISSNSLISAIQLVFESR